MIAIDLTQLDITSVCVGALFCWIWTQYILKAIFVWFIIPVGAILLGKSRESVINDGVEKARKRLEALLPHWTVNR